MNCVTTLEQAASHNAENVPFLCLLPGEIRNQIYELVLSVDDELTVGHAKDVEDGLDDTMLGVLATKIVVYNSEKRREWNQMKYVCKKMREETAGIELQFNTVRFADWDTWVEFHDAATSNKLQWLSHINMSLKSCWHTSFPRVQQLLSFCRACPRTKVNLRIEDWVPAPYRSSAMAHLRFMMDSPDPDFNTTPYDIIQNGILIAKVFRGVDIGFLRPRFSPHTALTMHLDPDHPWPMFTFTPQPGLNFKPETLESLKQFQSVTKLRFCLPAPLDEEGWKALRENIKWNEGTGSQPWMGVEGGMDTWQKYADEWFEHGI
jgi:hypothetical protein